MALPIDRHLAGADFIDLAKIAIVWRIDDNSPTMNRFPEVGLDR